MEFCLMPKNMGKNISKNINKNVSCKYTQKFLNDANQYSTDALKTISKQVIQKQQKKLVIRLVIKSLIKLKKSHK